MKAAAVVAAIVVVLALVAIAAAVPPPSARAHFRAAAIAEAPAFVAAALRTDLLPAYDFPRLTARYLRARSRGADPAFVDVVTRDRRTPNHPSLVEWEGKVSFYEMLDRLGVAHPAVIWHGQPRDARELEQVLEGHDRFVLKPTHMSENEGVVVYDRGTNLLTQRPITRRRTAEIGSEMMGRTTKDFETDALKMVTPGILVEELVPCAYEVKFTVVWGRVFVGKVMRKDTRLPWRRKLGEVTRDGTHVPSQLLGQPRFAAPPYYSDMVADAEKVCRGTDLIRLDFLCTRDGYVVGEATPLSASRLSPGAEAAVVKLLVDGQHARSLA